METKDRIFLQFVHNNYGNKKVTITNITYILQYL